MVLVSLVVTTSSYLLESDAPAATLLFSSVAVADQSVKR